jgi:hypothetical protein
MLYFCVFLLGLGVLENNQYHTNCAVKICAFKCEGKIHPMISPKILGLYILYIVLPAVIFLPQTQKIYPNIGPPYFGFEKFKGIFTGVSNL